MRLVDSFINIALYTRNHIRTSDGNGPGYDIVRNELMRLFDESMSQSLEHGYSEQLYTNAKRAVVAYVDELIQCSSWAYADEWKKEPLQRMYFDTTNLGDDFYEILNNLNKFGPDRDVREVYSLCLGLGFRGKYFNNSDRQKYEDVKSFNLRVLLNDEAQQDIDGTILFPEAYGKQDKRIIGNYKPRLNIIAYVIATPIVLISLVVLYGGNSISNLLSSIAAMVK